MNNTIRIEALPTSLSVDQTIEAVYQKDLDLIVQKLTSGTSVLIECDKQLTIHLYKAIRNKLKQISSDKRCLLISGHSDNNPATANLPYMQKLLRQLSEAVFSSTGENIIVLPHLDIVTTTTRSGLTPETREAAAILYENPMAIFLAFKELTFELPKVIENVFTLKHSMAGISREALPKLIVQSEARKFGVETFNPYDLYKFFSGLNAIRCRQILESISNRLDFEPSIPKSREDLFQDIRNMTLVTDVELPHVDLNNDIGGYDKVKSMIKTEILDLLVKKDSLTKEEDIKCIEEIIPKGIIFHGPPGTGKTFFAKAIATAINATIHIVSGPELKSRWVGESEENLRRIFANARKSAPSIIVFDELDSFAHSRSTYSGSGVEHSMVNQLLTEMDGFRKEELLFIIGTTNFLSSIDQALLRPGRFELSIEIPYPNESDRKAILDIYRKQFDLNINDEVLQHAIQRTGAYINENEDSRYSGDHLYALMRSIKREQLRRGENFEVSQDDIDKALDKKNKKNNMLEKEERTIAVHEAGHAVLAYVLPYCPTIEKITIATSEEDTLGYVMQAVKKNKYVTIKEELLNDICVLLGGRAAEFLLLGKVSMGAYSDLQRANEIARMMVEELGMAHDFGVRTYTQGGATSSLGDERKVMSESAAKEVDQQISNILEEQKKVALSLIEKYRPQLDALVETLLKEKTVKLKQVKEIFNDEDFKKHG